MVVHIVTTVLSTANSSRQSVLAAVLHSQQFNTAHSHSNTPASTQLLLLSTGPWPAFCQAHSTLCLATLTEEYEDNFKVSSLLGR